MMFPIKMQDKIKTETDISSALAYNNERIEQIYLYIREQTIERENLEKKLDGLIKHLNLIAKIAPEIPARIVYEKKHGRSK